MNLKTMKTAWVLLLALFFSMPKQAIRAEENDVEFEIGADVVSSFIWRGQDCGGSSIQPSATISWKGLSFEVWASAELFGKGNAANMQEFDLSLSYEIDNFSFALTDFTFCQGDYFSNWTFNESSSHTLEATIGYNLDFLSLTWSTVIAGYDHNTEGKRLYSSYVEIEAPFSLGGLECSAAVGACPWEDSFTTGGENSKFNVVNCSLTATKELKGFPVMGQIVYNPQSDATFFVVGVSF